MYKKWLLVLVCLLFAGGAVFSDGDTEIVFPKNTITFDASLAYATLLVWGDREITFLALPSSTSGK